METKLSQEELNERIQILKKFRQLLEQQRTKFQEYLKVLEAQESKINEENAEALLAHARPAGCCSKRGCRLPYGWTCAPEREWELPRP